MLPTGTYATKPERGSRSASRSLSSGTSMMRWPSGSVSLPTGRRTGRRRCASSAPCWLSTTLIHGVHFIEPKYCGRGFDLFVGHRLRDRDHRVGVGLFRIGALAGAAAIVVHLLDEVRDRATRRPVRFRRGPSRSDSGTAHTRGRWRPCVRAPRSRASAGDRPGYQSAGPKPSRICVSVNLPVLPSSVFGEPSSFAGGTGAGGVEPGSGYPYAHRGRFAGAAAACGSGCACLAARRWIRLLRAGRRPEVRVFASHLLIVRLNPDLVPNP